MNKKILVSVAIAAVIVVLLITVRSIIQFSTASPGQVSQRDQIQSLRVEDPYAPEVQEVSDEDAAQLRAELEQAAYAAIMDLNSSVRPQQTDARRIAEVFAEFVSICRTGTPENHVAMVESRGREPDKRFLNPEKKDGFWRTNTGWAREAPLEIDGVLARPRSIRGEDFDITKSQFPDGPGTVRRLTNGKMPFFESNDRTIYEIIIPATLASTKGERVEGSVGVLIADDARVGKWDTLGVMSHGTPQGFIIFLTPP